MLARRNLQPEAAPASLGVAADTESNDGPSERRRPSGVGINGRHELHFLPEFAKHLGGRHVTAVARAALDSHVRIAQLHVRHVSPNQKTDTGKPSNSDIMASGRSKRGWCVAALFYIAAGPLASLTGLLVLVAGTLTGHTTSPRTVKEQTTEAQCGSLFRTCACVSLWSGIYRTRTPIVAVPGKLSLTYVSADVQPSILRQLRGPCSNPMPSLSRIVPGSHRDLRNPRGPADGINTQAPIPHELQVAAPAGSVFIRENDDCASLVLLPGSLYQRASVKLMLAYICAQRILAAGIVRPCTTFLVVPATLSSTAGHPGGSPSPSLATYTATNRRLHLKSFTHFQNPSDHSWRTW